MLTDRCDLHVHTNYSDGKLLPSQVIDEAIKAGLLAIAITDHDNFNAYKEASMYADEHRFNLIPGIELTCNINSHWMDLLGLGFDPDKIEVELGRFYELKLENDKLYVDHTLSKFKELGYKAIYNSESINRSTKANYFISDIVQSFPENRRLFKQRHLERCTPHLLYEYYMQTGRPCFCVGFANFYESQLAIINNSGGLAFVAHPRRKEYFVTDEEILFLKNKGLAGIEIFYPTHTTEDTNHLLSFSKANNLLASGGSDFHHFGKGALGIQTISYNLLPEELKRFIKFK